MPLMCASRLWAGLRSEPWPNSRAVGCSGCGEGGCAHDAVLEVEVGAAVAGDQRVYGGALRGNAGHRFVPRADLPGFLEACSCRTRPALLLLLLLLLLLPSPLAAHIIGCGEAALCARWHCLLHLPQYKL